jgi:hypothetical protein
MRFIWIAILFVAFAAFAFGQTTEITYQGQLQSSSAPASGSFDFEFALFDGAGSQIGSVLTRNGVSVSGGIFSVNLDFGAGFPGATRFLEIRVRQSGGGAFTTLSPRQAVTSAPYSIKSLAADTADSAANATNALTATNFSGNLAGDVTGTQSNTTVARLQNRNVASTPPLDGQVLKFDSVANQWVPATDNAGTGGGGGTITGVTPGTGLTGGGTTGNVTLGIGPGGVGTGQLAEGSVVDSKIVTVSGGKVIGTVANATNAINASNAATAATATDATNAANASNLGGVPASQYLQANGNGSGLTNLNASSITTGTLSNARLGQISTANIADSAVTSAKIASGQVVKNLNGLTDNISLAAGANITITPSGNTLTIASTGGAGGVGGGGTAGQVALWTGASTLGVAQISQSGGNIGVGTIGAPTDRLTVQTATDNYGVVHTNGAIAVGSFVGGSTGGGWFGTRSNHPLSFFTNNSGASLTIATNGNVGIGLNNPSTKLHVAGSAPTTSSILGTATGNSGIGVEGRSSVGTGVLGEGSGSSDGVTGQTTSGTGVVGFSSFGRGVEAEVIGQGAIALKTSGTSFFKGDTTPLSAANAGSGTGIAIGTSGDLGYISSFDYGAFQARTLLLNNSGGNVGIGTNAPTSTLTVNGTASKPGGGSWAVFSDERLKTITGRFNGGLKAVMRLQPLRYEYKKENLAGVKSDGEHIGFSAQAVEKVIPEAVTKSENGIRLVNNDPIIFAMLNAIKEQQATIAKLAKQVRQLQRANLRKRGSRTAK